MKAPRAGGTLSGTGWSVALAIVMYALYDLGQRHIIDGAHLVLIVALAVPISVFLVMRWHNHV